MRWNKVALGDLITITKGKKHLETDDSTSNRYLQIEDLNGHFTKKYTKENGTYVNEKDIVIVWDGANAGKVGCGLSGVIGSTLARLTFKKPEIEPRFVKRYLDYKFEFIKSQRTGATIPHVSGEALRGLLIPLPSFDIQQKIASILDKADELRHKDKQLLAKYDELLQSIFYQMFGDPVINNKKWSSKSVKTFLNDIVAGSSYGGEERQLNEGELGVLKVSAVTWGFFDSKEYKAVKKEVINKKIIIPKKGDLLFSRANTRELVGATCIVDDDYPYLFLPDKLWRVGLDSTKCNQYYFHLLLSIPEFKERLTKTATGTSGSMLNISMEKLKQLEIPLPPIELQNNFAGIVENIESQRKLTKETLQSSEFLFQSLLQKAFKGELVK